MNYRETLDYLFSRLPVFTRIGKAAYKADLNNITALCAALRNPEKELKTIHIAGTNGKGSSSHFIASVLQEAGFKTGLFTSPHLKDFRERIKVNGKMISRQNVVKFSEKNRLLFEELNPSFFEMTVALAFDHFRKQKVDIAVIETGLGGRLDSTNLIDPEASLITNISKDHMDLLGDTIEKIAYEKAGIIKKNKPVIIGERNTATDAVFEKKAVEMNAQILFAEDYVYWNKKENSGNGILALNGEISLPGYKNKYPLILKSGLAGNYQEKNIKGVLIALEVLKTKGWKISASSIQRGIKNVKKNTGLRGRWEIVNRDPLVICDTAHNEAGIMEVLEQIAGIKFRQLHIVWGMVGDKDVDAVLRLLPSNAIYYFCSPAIPRGMLEQDLMEKAGQYGLEGRYFSSVKKAVFAARQVAKPDDVVYIGGSTFVVAEAI